MAEPVEYTTVVQMLAQAHPHIKQMSNRVEIENILKIGSCTLALQLCQHSGNVPPAIGTKRDECAPLRLPAVSDPASEARPHKSLCLVYLLMCT
jgi:hypothetical protein